MTTIQRMHLHGQEKKKGRPIEVGIHVKGDLDLRATMNAVFALFLKK